MSGHSYKLYITDICDDSSWRISDAAKRNMYITAVKWLPGSVSFVDKLPNKPRMLCAKSITVH